VSSVAHYASSIGECWYRGLTAMMEVARLCAEASNRLIAVQKSELIAKLPFGEATFSKLTQIGTDSRLHTPEVQRLLPAHYTTIYAVTLLNDEELSAAIAEKVIHTKIKRAELQRWCTSRREKVGVALNPHEAASDSAVASPPIVPARDSVDSGVVASALSQRETQDSLDQDGLAVSSEGAEEQSEQLKTGVCNNQSIGLGIITVDKLAPHTDDDERLERLKSRWEKHLAPDWKDAAEATRARFRVEVLESRR
jgi:hypothetical protein